MQIEYILSLTTKNDIESILFTPPPDLDVYIDTLMLLRGGLARTTLQPYQWLIHNQGQPDSGSKYWLQLSP